MDDEKALPRAEPRRRPSDRPLAPRTEDARNESPIIDSTADTTQIHDTSTVIEAPITIEEKEAPDTPIAFHNMEQPEVSRIIIPGTRGGFFQQDVQSGESRDLRRIAESLGAPTRDNLSNIPIIGETRSEEPRNMGRREIMSEHIQPQDIKREPIIDDAPLRALAEANNLPVHVLANEIASRHVAQGNEAVAVPLLKKAEADYFQSQTDGTLEREPADDQFLTSIGDSYRELGRDDDALRMYDESFRATADPESLQKKAEILVERDDISDRRQGIEDLFETLSLFDRGDKGFIKAKEKLEELSEEDNTIGQRLEEHKIQDYSLAYETLADEITSTAQRFQIVMEYAKISATQNLHEKITNCEGNLDVLDVVAEENDDKKAADSAKALIADFVYEFMLVARDIEYIKELNGKSDEDVRKKAEHLVDNVNLSDDAIVTKFRTYNGFDLMLAFGAYLKREYGSAVRSAILRKHVADDDSEKTKFAEEYLKHTPESNNHVENIKDDLAELIWSS